MTWGWTWTGEGEPGRRDEAQRRSKRGVICGERRYMYAVSWWRKCYWTWPIFGPPALFPVPSSPFPFSPFAQPLPECICEIRCVSDSAPEPTWILT